MNSFRGIWRLGGRGVPGAGVRSRPTASQSIERWGCQGMDKVRIDKWLWAARFFKTRTLATQAVEGGRVKLNGERCKPAKEVKAGDQLIIHISELEWEITIVALSDKRGPATVARTLYAELAGSFGRRQARMDERRLQLDPAAILKRRPTKKDRRKIHRFNEEF